VLLWAVTGPLFGYSDTWQLVINTATTVVTYLLVFVIQNSQNRSDKAIQLKLDELIVKLEAADNRFAGIEQRTEAELDRLGRQMTRDISELP
jgi:low affinity Fe/Cu permease